MASHATAVRAYRRVVMVMVVDTAYHTDAALLLCPSISTAPHHLDNHYTTATLMFILSSKPRIAPRCWGMCGDTQTRTNECNATAAPNSKNDRAKQRQIMHPILYTGYFATAYFVLCLCRSTSPAHAYIHPNQTMQQFLTQHQQHSLKLYSLGRGLSRIELSAT